jgi:hypothetical protein
MARDLSANLIPAAFPSRPKIRDSLASGLNSICIEFLFSDKIIFNLNNQMYL